MIAKVLLLISCLLFIVYPASAGDADYEKRDQELFEKLCSGTSVDAFYQKLTACTYKAFPGYDKAFADCYKTEMGTEWPKAFVDQKKALCSDNTDTKWEKIDKCLEGKIKEDETKADACWKSAGQ